MSVLEFGLKGFFTQRTYSLTGNGLPVGVIECSRMWEQATITIGTTSYTAAREGKMSGLFYLEANGIRLASAEKPSSLHRLFTVRAGGRTFSLKAASAFGRAFVFTENDVEIGKIARRGIFSSKSTAELPDDLAVEVQAFLIWLVIIIWRRQTRATTAAVIATEVR